MERYKRYISDEDAIQVVADGLFQQSQGEKFATVVLGYGLYPSGVREELFKGYLQFRKKVYVDQHQFLPESAVMDNGTEYDSDDLRAEHIAVLQDRGLGKVAIVACIRIVDKRNQVRLPIEEAFPDVFQGNPIPCSGVEVSRLISRSKGRIQQISNINELFMKALAHVDRHGLGPVYGLMGESVEKVLPLFGAPTTRVADLREVDHYQTLNLGVKIDADAMKQRVGQNVLDQIDIEAGSIEFWNKSIPIKRKD